MNGFQHKLKERKKEERKKERKKEERKKEERKKKEERRKKISVNLDGFKKKKIENANVASKFSVNRLLHTDS